MNEMQPATIAILRAIRDHGPITLRALDDLNIQSASARAAAMNLQTHKYIETWKRSINQGSTYSITPKGVRKLAALDVSKGDVAQPRQAVSSGPYTGERTAHARSGAQDAYSLPSLHLGELVERRRPMLMGSPG